MAPIDGTRTLVPPSIREVVEALNAGRAEAAFDTCLALTRLAPDEPAINQLAATAALRTDRPAEAWRFAQRSLARRPDHGPTLVLAGRAARILGRSHDAVMALARAVALAPGDAEPAVLLCLLRLEDGEPTQSLNLDRLAARFPRESATWDDIVRLLLAKGHREAALACLLALSMAAPSGALALRRGIVAKDLGRIAEASQAFEEAVRLAPNSARAWFLLGIASEDRRDRSRAIEAYRRALALDPAMAEAAVNLGTLLQEQGDLDAAKVLYAQAVTARPDTFGRVAQAITTARKGELWLDLDGLRRRLKG